MGVTAEGRATWTVLQLVLWSADYLAGKGVEHGRLDAEHLLAHALGKTRLQLYLEFERPLKPGELAAYKPLLLRRARREPLQYVIGRAVFRDLDLAVDPRVLVPRPETEALVERVLEWAHGREDLEAVDVGTGSGCVALALLSEGPFRRVVATDISREALAVAASNARTAGLADRLELRAGALWSPLGPDEGFDLVVSNPPYVADAERTGLQPEVRDWEPAVALFAGPSGLEVLEALAEGAGEWVRAGGLLALEVGLGQADAVAERIRRAGGFGPPSVGLDLAGRRRIVTAVRG